MAIIDKKIAPADYSGNDIVGLSDTPSDDGMSANELKAQFDRLAKDVLVPRYNALIDQLASVVTNTSGARYIGFDATSEVFYQSVYDAIIGVAGSRVKGTVRITVSTTAPSTPNVNDIWIDTN